MLQLRMKPFLSLRVFTLIGEMPLGLLNALLRKSINLVVLEIDSDSDMEGGL
jgi:hypothetical protein